MKTTALLLIPVAVIATIVLVFFRGGDPVSALAVPRTESFPATLLEAGVFDDTGDIVLADLVPSDDYVLYDLGSSLFSDHSSKQRLLSLPEGTQLTLDGDGLPVFPDGTSIAKTMGTTVVDEEGLDILPEYLEG